MIIHYYTAANSGRQPVDEYILALRRGSASEASAILEELETIRDRGLVTTNSRPLGNKLFELKIGRHRILYCVVDGEMVLLHAYKKQSQKAPQKDMELARKRQKEIQNENE